MAERPTASRSGLEEQVAGLCQLAADEDALGREQVARARDGAAEGAAGVGDDAPAPDVAGLRLEDDLAQREAVAVAAAQGLEDGFGAGEGLQAAAVAAAADRPAVVDRHVADLAGGASRAVVEPPVEDEAGADPGGDLDVDEVRAVAPSAPHDLRQSAEVGVVLDAHRQAELGLHERLRARADPAGQDGRVPDLAAVAAQRAWKAHADAGDAVGRHADVVEQPTDEAPGQRDALVGLVVDVERLLGLGEDGVREVGDGHAHVRVAEVDADGIGCTNIAVQPRSRVLQEEK